VKRWGKQGAVSRPGGFSQLAVPLLVGVAVAAPIALMGGSLSARPPVAPQVTPSPTELSFQQEQGRELYMRDCAWCHDSAGEGSIYGPPLEDSGPASTDFMLRTGRMPIEQPERDPPAGPAEYSPEEIEQITAYASTFGEGPPIPEVQPDEGSLEQGAVLYQENCAACHSSTGIGAALTSGETAPGVRSSSATEIGEAVRVGGAGLETGDMPRFDERTLTPDELDSLARYILVVLQAPRDPGGLPLGHIGPVAEGFVAVFVLLPLMLLVIRWLGKKTT
jgi:ubiquinol-cytochrome c reductase cytochrome c subunit